MAAKELLDYVPDCFLKRFLVLGSTNGEFIDGLAKIAQDVTIVGLTKKEVAIMQHRLKPTKNATFLCADSGGLNFPQETFDVVVSDSLFVNSTDDEMNRIIMAVLNWIKPSGHYFLLEPSASLNPVPTKRSDIFIPRTHTQYCQAIMTNFNSKAAFQIIKGKNLKSFVDVSGRRNGVCFVAERVERKAGDNLEGLMDIRYSNAFIFKLEWIFGHTWVSTGGETTTRDFCGRFNLRQNQRVLDAGCGTGGSAFFMARHYGVHVHGVDISTNMINIAIDRLGHCEKRLRNSIQFEIQDLVEAEYQDNSYDVIYSRDVILHIQEKERLFAKIYRWLKPGGVLFITDYCKGIGEATDDYLEYERKACSHFQTVESYGSDLQAAGFKDVKAEDLADQFYGIQKEEREAFIPTKDTFVKEYSQKEFDELDKITANKLVWVKNGQFTWGAFTATK